MILAENFTRNSAASCRAPNREVKLLRPVTHVGASQPFFRLFPGKVSQSVFSKDLSELRCEVLVRRCINVNRVVKYFLFKLGAALSKLTAGIGNDELPIGVNRGGNGHGFPRAAFISGLQYLLSEPKTLDRKP